jgi:CubicO group peptidase (beta-lactamase class C family)
MIVTLFGACTNAPDSTGETTITTPLPIAPLLDPNSHWVDSVYNTLSWEERLGELIWTSYTSELDILPPVGGFIFREKIPKQVIHQTSNKDTCLKPLYLATNGDIGFANMGLSPEWKGLGTCDTAFIEQLTTHYLSLLHQYGIHGFLIDSNSISRHLPNRMVSFWRNKLDENHIITLDTVHPRLKFFAITNGPLSAVDTVEQFIYSTQINDFITDILNGNATFIVDSDIRTDSLTEHLKTLSNMVKTLPNAESLLAPKVRKMLALKEYCTVHTNLPTYQGATTPTNLIGLSNRLLYQGNVLLRNDGTLPIGSFPKKKWRYIVIGNQSLPDFLKGIRHYADITEDRKTSLTFNLNDFSGAGPLIVILHQQAINQSTAAEWVKKVRDAHKKLPIITVVIGGQGAPLLNELPVLVEVPVDTKEAHYYLGQQLMGGLPINGFTENDEFTFLSSAKTRLAFTIPEEVGIHRDSLKKIDKIAHEAILSKATPGCQVFVAKEGKVLLNKSYGYHAYDYKTAVLNDHVYDIASVTKVAATTMLAMHLYEKGRFQLADSLKNYLPDTLTKFLKHPSRLNSITFQELLTHKSGLPSGLPIYKFIAYVNKLIGRFDRYFCDESNKFYCVEVAKDFYLDSAYLDSLWVDMNRIWPGEKVFKYSDANMNALYQVMRPMIKGKKSYDRYLDSILYQPLQLKTMGFLPLKYLDTTRHRIAPTEYDTYWRYQVIRGHVHDPNAALYGGVAGNAGLFSNAYDLGLLFQLLLQKGSYGGQRYFLPETVELFTKHQPNSHRGLGFDKPTANSGNVVAPDAPYTTYGHTGFTGICAWADPENELVFVFTSNRVHPSPNNKKLIEHGIRKRIHQVVYQQLHYNGSYRNKATGDVPITHLATKELTVDPE